MPLYDAFVIGMDIKPEYQVIHINFANVWFLLNVVRAIETVWIVQLNGDATFGSCRADIDMIALRFIWRQQQSRLYLIYSASNRR